MLYLLAAWEGIGASLSFLVRLALIIFPLMIMLSIAEEFHIMDVLSKLLRPLGRPLTLSPRAILPLLIGLIFGFSFGAGAIIKSAEGGGLSQREMGLVGSFLAICHAVFEDTLLLVALGAQLFWILIFRFLLAFLVVFLLSRTLLAK